jgi:hypothetical protein
MRNSSNFRYELLSLVLALGVLHCRTAGIAFGQEAAPSSGGITNIEATTTIGLRIEIRASDQPIAIPYCGEDGAGEYFFCSGEAHLEVSRRGNWVAAKPRKGLLAVMGSDSDEDRKHLLIAPGKTVYFVFTFSKDFFGIEKGEHLQMRINTWRSSESIGSRDSQIIFSSPVFECP